MLGMFMCSVMQTSHVDTVRLSRSPRTRASAVVDLGSCSREVFPNSSGLASTHTWAKTLVLRTLSNQRRTKIDSRIWCNMCSPCVIQWRHVHGHAGVQKKCFNCTRTLPLRLPASEGLTEPTRICSVSVHSENTLLVHLARYAL